MSVENIKQYIFLTENEIDKLAEKEGYVNLMGLKDACEVFRQAIADYENLTQGRGK